MLARLNKGKERVDFSIPCTSKLLAVIPMDSASVTDLTNGAAAKSSIVVQTAQNTPNHKVVSFAPSTQVDKQHFTQIL